MFKKKYNISINYTIPQIVEKLENITKGKHLSGHKRVKPYYIGEYDKSGFTFLRSEVNFLGNHIFSAKFIELESKTEIIASIRPSVFTSIFYISIVALMLISIVVSPVSINLTNVIVLVVLFPIPIIIMYLSFRSDVKKAELFLAELSQKMINSI